MKAAGLITDDETATSSEETKVEKSEGAQATEGTTASAPDANVETLSKAVTSLTEIVTALADRVSDGGAPAVVQKAESTDPLAELKAVEDPIERLRLSLAVAHGEGQR